MLRQNFWAVFITFRALGGEKGFTLDSILAIVSWLITVSMATLFNKIRTMFTKDKIERVKVNTKLIVANKQAHLAEAEALAAERSKVSS